jgi:hypothetical protein
MSKGFCFFSIAGLLIIFTKSIDESVLVISVFKQAIVI